MDPLKEIKRCGRWIIEAQKYVYEMNKVLETEVATRNVDWDKMMVKLKPPNNVKDNLKLTNFLHGKLVVWNNKKHVFSHTEGQPGYLTCDVCGTKHRFKKSVESIATCNRQATPPDCKKTTRHCCCCPQSKLNEQSR